MAKNTPPGPGVDASGQTVIDPTQNVLDLVRAETRRQDDLRDLQAAHVREIMALRAANDLTTRQNEADRINSIRQVDVAAAAASAKVLADQVTALATQAAVTADALRNQVAATATAKTVELTAALVPIQTDVADLRKTQFTLAGQAAQVYENRTETRAAGMTTGMWLGLGVAVAAIFAALLVAIIGAAVAIYLHSTPQHPATPAATAAVRTL